MSWVFIPIQKASILLLFKEQKPADVALEQSKHERIGTALQAANYLSFCDWVPSLWEIKGNEAHFV